MAPDADAHHAALLELLRGSARVPDAVLDAFARVPRHAFLPGVPLASAYADDAVVTRDEDGIPTSSSSQPSLMARMLAQLELAPGQRVLEIGTGTGYNAALLAALGAAVTSVELQPDVAEAARAQLRAAGFDVGAEPAAGPGDGAAPPPGGIRVVTGDGAAPPAGAFDRVVVTAALWSLPASLADAVGEDGLLVAPLRINALEAVFALRREGSRLTAAGAIPCGFMPLRGGAERPWRWPLGAGGAATADVDLGDEGRGALDRLLASPARTLADPLELREGEHPLDALLWLGLQGDPLLTLAVPRPDGSGPAWTLALDVLPASLLVLELAAGNAAIGSARLHGGDGALRACAAGLARWRAAGAPGPDRLALTVEPRSERDTWALPHPSSAGAATLTRGAHRWTLHYASR